MKMKIFLALNIMTMLENLTNDDAYAIPLIAFDKLY
jgi:hypothetical protein